MPELKKITSISACTTFGNVYGGVAQIGEILPCGHEVALFCVDSGIVEALQNNMETKPSKPVSKSNARMLTAYGKAWQIRSMSKPIAYILILSLTLLYYATVDNSLSLANLFLAGGAACMVMESKNGFPGKFITNLWANKLCPANAYDKIRVYVGDD